MKRPNFLFVMVDQMSQFVLPTAQPQGRDGHPKAIAPNIASLAARGRVFRSCYSNSPLCVPARATFMTSEPVRTHRVCTNGDEFCASIPTFLHGLKKDGYETILSGKMHFVGPDQLHGFDNRLTTDIYPSDFVWARDWNKDIVHEPGTSVIKLDVPGACKTNMQLRYDLEVKNRAVEYLHDYALSQPENPFFLLTSFTQPHEPFTATQKYWDLYADLDMTLPDDGDPSDVSGHPFNTTLNRYHGIDQHQVDAATKRKAIRAHLAMISQIDDYVGELLETLDTVGLREDTVVILTSDHGEMLGAHGMWFKRTFYEESVHVPLIVSAPDATEAGVSDEIVSLSDLGPTVLELAGISDDLTRFKVMGQSFAGLIDETKSGTGSNRATVDYLGDGTNTPMFMIREQDWKYVWFEEYEPILFNLRDDPHEQRNLADQPQYKAVAEDLKSKLLGSLDVRALVDDVQRKQQARLYIQDSRKKSESDRLLWDFQPRRDATKQYVRGRPNSNPQI